MACTFGRFLFSRLMAVVALGAALLTCAAAAGASNPSTEDIALSRTPALRAAVLSPVAVNAPSNVISVEGDFVSITATAVAADPQASVTITASGAPSELTFSTNTPTNDHPSATISGILGPGSVGIWTIRWEAVTSLGESAVDSTVLFVKEANAAPVLTPPASMTVDEGSVASQNLSASDADGDVLFFSKILGPSFMTVGTTSGTTGRIDLWPNTLEAGTYPARVVASDGKLFTQSDTFYVTVNDVPHAPVADPGGPYYGIGGVPILIDGTRSYDPDGDPLRYLWTFQQTYPWFWEYELEGPTLSRSFYDGSVTKVILVVTDNGDPPLSSGPAYTSVTIKPLYPAKMFLSAPNQTLRLDSSKPTWCVQVQLSAGLPIETVISDSTTLTYGERVIHAIGGKTVTLGDANRDGIPDIAQCFTKSDLVWLLAPVPPGHSLINLLVTGVFTLGRFQGLVRTEVVKSSAVSGVTVSPNPLNPGGTVNFTTSRAGPVTFRVYDLQGKLVRTVLREPSLPAGEHELRLDARADDGSPLASGIYFYRFEAPGERASGRFCVLK